MIDKLCDQFLLQASFTATKKGDDIDIDDPDFWRKWAMKADIDVDELLNKVPRSYCDVSVCFLISTPVN